MPSTPAVTEPHPLTGRLMTELRMQPDAGLGDSGADRVLALATARFMAQRRVDMGMLAREAGVGRVTLYRWFGDRETLLARVLWVLSRQALAWLAARDDPTPAHTLASVQVFMEVTNAYPPLRHFLATEPAAALRIMLDPGSPLVESLTGWAADRLTTAGFGASGDPGADELAGVLVSMTSTYCWARVIAGGEADIAGAMRAVRMLLRA
jgi:AcrR family transcriptional regulator